jgi:hypothetical protein
LSGTTATPLAGVGLSAHPAICTVSPDATSIMPAWLNGLALGVGIVFGVSSFRA